MLAPHAKPNAAHKKLAQWEKEGKLKAVITQNIDGLHQAAGSKTVLELHGSTLRNYCMKCGGFTIRMQFWKAQGFRTANAAAWSNRMSYSMKKAWIRKC